MFLFSQPPPKQIFLVPTKQVCVFFFPPRAITGIVCRSVKYKNHKLKIFESRFAPEMHEACLSFSFDCFESYFYQSSVTHEWNAISGEERSNDVNISLSLQHIAPVKISLSVENYWNVKLAIKIM